MPRKLILLVMLSLCAALPVSAQKRKAPPRRAQKTTKPTTKTTTKTPPVRPVAPTLGSTIHLVTKNGDRLTGELLDLNAFSIRFKADGLESTLALETIASITFGEARGGSEPAKPVFAPVGDAFKRESGSVVTAFQAMAAETRSGSSYTEYDRQLTQLRRAADRFIQKYSLTENPTEARAVSLLTGAVLDYHAARTIWTLKIGTNGTLAETDAPAIADTLALYPELRAQAAAGERFSADKLIGNLWKKATEKVNLVQAMVR